MLGLRLGRAVVFVLCSVYASAQVPYLVKDMVTGSGSASSYPGNFAVAGTKMYFTADVAGLGSELW